MDQLHLYVDDEDEELHSHSSCYKHSGWVHNTAGIEYTAYIQYNRLTVEVEVHLSIPLFRQQSAVRCAQFSVTGFFTS